MPANSERLDRVWWLILFTIPAMSLLGRALLALLSGGLGSQLLAGTLTAMLIVLAAWGLLLNGRRVGRTVLLHFVWLLPLLYGLPTLLPLAEERLHLILFGLFGYLSVRRHGDHKGLLLALGLALLDEGLQALLPYRVGDWRDVLANAAAVLGGALLTLPRMAWR